MTESPDTPPDTLPGARPDIRFVYITASGLDEARELGSALIEARLAACVNILDPMMSMYWWQGEVAETQETVLIAKTRAGLVDRLTALVQEIHSYSCPCVVALPVSGGNPSFLDWIAAETALPD